MKYALFDTECYDLASHFLENIAGANSDRNATQLAIEIQEVVERFIDNLDPTPE